MARQRIHNRRAARGSVGGGASWISYSDMMAALLLIFVLILAYSLSHYFSMLEAKDLQLRQSTHELSHTTHELEQKTQQLDQKDRELDLKDQELDQQKTQLTQARAELQDKEEQLKLSQEELDAATLRLLEQQSLLDTQTRRIDDLIGIRTTMIRDLSASLSKSNLKATVDPNTGDIVLDSSVFFETGKSTIKEEGRELLNRFIPVYLNVLLRDEYSGYLGEIIIEGHTDSKGSYESNLKLSQDRALQVALYCLNLPSLTSAQKQKLQEILTAKGRSYSDLVYDSNGLEDADASRRVEFKFSLKDAEMIAEMNRILSRQESEE